MNQKLWVVFLGMAIGLFSCTDKTPDPSATLVIANANIVDPLKRQITSARTIVINGDQIIGIHPSSERDFNYPDSITIDATGQFVLPGFWNMHTHICWSPDLDQQIMPTMLEYGVTGARDMGGSLELLNLFKEMIRSDPLVGPELYGPGPILDGEQPIHPDFSAALSASNYIGVLDSLRSGKVDFFKVYSLLPKEIIEGIADYCATHNIPFAGHISELTTPEYAVSLGQKSIEHLNRLEDIDDDSTAFEAFISAATASGAWHCPTAIIFKRKRDLAHGQNLEHPTYHLIGSDLQAEWEAARVRREGTEGDPQKLEEIAHEYAKRLRLIRRIYDRKIPMLVGSDFAGMPFVFPGYSLHEEMAILSEIGIDNYDILKMATYHPALYLGITEQHGSIEAGKLANLVLLTENPVVDIASTLQIAQVVRRGRKVLK